MATSRATSAWQVFHLIVPFGQQTLALSRGVVFREVIVDEFDLREIGRLGRWFRVLVGGHLIGFRFVPNLLRFAGPVVAPCEGTGYEVGSMSITSPCRAER